MIITLSGESGSGKTTIAAGLHNAGFPRIVTYTSRVPRATEISGVDYMFETRERIEALHALGRLWEISEFCGNLYGSPEVNPALNYCVVVDEVGAIAYKEHYQSSCVNVLVTAGAAAIVRNLKNRGDVDEILKYRKEERKPSVENFDLVVNSGVLTPQQCVSKVLEYCGTLNR